MVKKTKYEHWDRGHWVRNKIALVLFLAGGWRSYQSICEEFNWRPKTVQRNLKALEEAGLPLEGRYAPVDMDSGLGKRVRLPTDWVERTIWLRRYIIRKTPLTAPAYQRSLHK